MDVLKRNGEREHFNVEKIHKVVEYACDGISGVSVSDVIMAAHLKLYDGIKSTDIHKELINSAANLISEQSPNYQFVAGKLLNYSLRKMVWGGMTPPSLKEQVDRMVALGFYTDEFSTMYSDAEWERLNAVMVHDRDLKMSYIGIKEYIDKYSVRDRSLNGVFPEETPQFTYMLAAILSNYNNLHDLKSIKNTYDQYSLWYVSLPTPIMAGLRTSDKQFSSCTKISIDDNLDSLAAGLGAVMKYAANKAGIGLDLTRIRAEGSPVRKTKSISHTGLIPFIRAYEGALKSCSQGGVRGASMTVHLLFWHLDAPDLLVLKNNKGTPDSRVRKVDYSFLINDYLYQRLIKKKNITLFCPRQAVGLYEAFFDNPAEFARLYEKYEADSSIRKRTVKAVDHFFNLITERKETGRIFVMNVDNVGPHKPLNERITTSNLCQEILIATSPLKHLYDAEAMIALCTLAAINVGICNTPEDLESACKTAVRSLDTLLDYQDYMVPAAHTSTRKYRPLGIGVINLAYYLAKNNVTYNNEGGWQMLDDLMESITFYCIKASIELAKERGVCEGYEETKWASGLLPIDYYKPSIDEIVKFTPKMDWEWLRGQLKLYGIRNALLTAFMPAESSAKISNATSGVDAVRSLVTVKGNKLNVSKQVVPEIQRLKNKYDMLWEMPNMTGFIKSMAIINRLCSQSVSTNLSYDKKNYQNGIIPASTMIKDLLDAAHYGLPTLYYHNNNDNRDEDQGAVVELNNQQTPELEPIDDECDSCKI